MHVNIYMMHACIYIYMLELCHLIRSLCLNRNILYARINVLLAAYNTTSKTYFEKKTKKWKENKKEKKTFSPGLYYQPGLKVPVIVACQEAPLVSVPDPELKNPFSPGCLLPGEEPRLEGVPHRE